MQGGNARSPESCKLLIASKAFNTYYQYRADQGCRPVDSCLVHQKLYHYHRHSRKHRLQEKEISAASFQEITE